MKKYLYLFLAGAGLSLLSPGCASSDADAPAAPVIRAERPEIGVPVEGGPCEIGYTLENAGSDARVSASCTEEWLHDFDASQAGRVRFTADPNSDEAARTGTVTLELAGAQTVRVIVRQSAAGEEPLFRITCSEPATSQITVEWVPAQGVGSYFSLVTEKAYFDRFPDDEAYIADDLEYIRKRAELYEVTFEQMLANYLATETRRSRIEGLKPDTEYYAYAYGMTPLGEPTTGIVKSLFRTEAVGRIDCSFTFSVTGRTAFGADVEVSPSDKSCTYFWDCVERKTFDAFGTPDQVIQTNIEYIRQAVEIWQMAGYDYSFSDFLTVGDDSNALGELNPDTEYVLFAFGLDESGVATTDLRTDAFRTEPFVPTDDCTFTVGFERVAATRMNVTVAPSNPATRYYVGLCDASNLDRYTTDELAGQFIAQENRNGLDWGGNRYIFTGVRSLDTAADLDLEELAADTEYAAVVFGIGADGIRTTLAACARCRTERVPQSEMTVEITVTNITSLGAVVTFRPSVDDETYFTDCIDYETYAAYDGDDEAFVRSVVAQLGSGIDAYLTVGYHRLDAEGYLQPGTAYVAYAFGYSGGVTTPLMKSERFVTEPLSTGSPAEVVITAEVRDGDDFYAADPVKYASYRGKAVIYAHLEPNAHAVHWYAGAFKDLSGYSDEAMIPVLKAQGRQDARELGNLAEWGGSLTYAAVTTDAQGAYGRLERKTVRADRSAVTTTKHRPTAVVGAVLCPDVPKKRPVATLLPTAERVSERADPVRPVGFFRDAAGRGVRLASAERSPAHEKRQREVRFR